MVDDLNRKFTAGNSISDELLSAYLDGEVTPEERALVERSLTSGDAAWRLDALRQTVAWVGQLPRVPLPHSFTLSEADVLPVRGGQPWWRAFLSPVFLRNATAVATMLFLVVLVGNLILSNAAPAAPAPASATVVVMQVSAEIPVPEVAPLAANEDAAAKVAPSPDAAAMSAAGPAAAPTPEAGAALETERQTVVSGAAEPTQPAPLPTAPDTTSSAAVTVVPEAAVTTAPDAAPQGVVTTVPEAAQEAPAIALAETAPAVEIATGAQDVPDQGSAPARGGTATGQPWLDAALVALGGLALLLFVAWQISLRSARADRR